MQTKLTLRLEKPLIDRAKLYAQSHDKSLSQIVADYFRMLTIESADAIESSNENLPPITASLVGLLADVELDEQDYIDYLEAKYA